MLEQLSNTAAAAGGAVASTATAAGGAVASGAGAAWNGVARGSAIAYKEGASQVAAFGVAIPSSRLMGAVAGHAIHQSVCVGVPTFLREVMAEALVLSMRHMPPESVVALQALTGVVTVGVQLYRRTRENRNPDAAARGFHSLTEEQWHELPDSKKADLRRLQVAHSRLVTNLQIASSMAHLAVSMTAARSNDPSLAELPARILATDLKAGAYATMRDTLQASFNLVGTDGPTTGVSGTHMNSSASFFAVMAAATNYGFSYLPAQVPNSTLASKVLRGTAPPDSEMTRSEAWQARVAVAAVKAAINTTLHASDWIYMTQEEANQAGTVQRWKPSSKLLNPESHDFSRIQDHVPTRIALLAGGNSLGNVISFSMRNSPEWMGNAVQNFADAAYQGGIYKTIVATWQAEGEVRANPVPVASQPTSSTTLSAEQDPGISQRSRIGSSRLT